MSSAARRPPIRVLHLIKGLGRGGAEMLLLEGIRTVDRRRFTFGYGYFLPWKNALSDALADEGADVVCFGQATGPRILLAARQVADFARKWKADVLHCHLPLTGTVGRIAGRLAGIPVVYTEHNEMERYHPLTRRLSLVTWRWQREVIAVSGEVAASIQRHADPRVPVRVVRNGVDAAYFDPSALDAEPSVRALGIPAHAPVVGTVAVFRTQKRLDCWIDAAASIRQQLPNAQFLLVGDGPLRSQVEARTAAAQLDAHVHFVGLQSDVRPFLAAMDVFMMSSSVEGLPVALLEAMAMQRAIVATDVGGIPEVISHNVNGVLVAPLQSERLAAACLDLLCSPERRAELGMAARETVIARFSVARMTRELEAIYAQCAAPVHERPVHA